MHIPLSLSPHFPPVFSHCLQTFFVPFSDQLLDTEVLLDLDAPDPGVKPVELADREELFENVRLPVLLGYLRLSWPAFAWVVHLSPSRMAAAASLKM